MTLKERLDAATSADNKWNSWPDKLEVVGFKVYDHQDPGDMYHMGYLLGAAQEYRQIRWTEFDYQHAGYDNEDKPLVEIRRHLPQPAYGQGYTKSSLVYVWFGLAAARGQQDDGGKRNIQAIFEPQKRYNSLFKRQEIVTHGLVVEIGCKHDYSDSGSNHQRGLHRGRCKRCGHTYLCDSGD